MIGARGTVGCRATPLAGVRVRGRSGAGLALLLAAVAGCGGVEPPSVMQASLELGTGTWRFDEVMDGQSVDLIRGAQGGWHVWVALRAAGFEPERGALALRASDADSGEVLSEGAMDAPFDPANDDGERLLLGWPQIFSQPGCVVGRLVRIEATWTAPNGTTLHAEHDLVIAPGADPPPPCGDGVN